MWIFLVLASILILGVFSTQDVMAAQLIGLAHTGPDGPSTMYTINTATGVATSVGATGFERCSSMDHDPTGGKLFAVCERNDGSDVVVLVTLNTITGAGSEVGAITGVPHSFGVAFADISFRNSDSVLYAYLEGGDGVGTIATGTPALTELGSALGFSSLGNGIAFNPADTLQHALHNLGTGATSLNTINQVTGASTFLITTTMPSGTTPRIAAMDYNPDTGILFGALFEDRPLTVTKLVTITPGTGTVTSIGTTQLGLDAIAFIPDKTIGGTLVPIDTTALLLAGVQSISMWMIPVVAAGVAIGVFVIKRRK